MSAPTKTRTRPPYDPYDYHDPTGGMLGAAPARSALGLRLALAVFGTAMLVAAVVLFVAFDLPTPAVAIVAFLIAVSLADVVNIARRRRIELHRS